MLQTCLRSPGRPTNANTPPRRWPPLGKTGLRGSQTIEVWKNIGANRSPAGGSVHTRAPSYRGSITTILLPQRRADSPGMLHAQGPSRQRRPVVDPHQAPHQPARWLNDWEHARTSPMPSLPAQMDVLKQADPTLGIHSSVKCQSGGERQSSSVASLAAQPCSSDAPSALGSGCPLPRQ